MRAWKFDENRCAFDPVAPQELQRDPKGTYLVNEGDDLYLRESESSRRVAHDETLILVAGVPFDRDQFDDAGWACQSTDPALHGPHIQARPHGLSDEMRRDGAQMRQWLEASEQLSTWIKDQMLPAAEEAWEYIAGHWCAGPNHLSAGLGLSPDSLLPVLRLDFGRRQVQKVGYPVIGTLMGTWTGDRLLEVKSTLCGRSVDLAEWWRVASPWFELPAVSVEAAPLD